MGVSKNRARCGLVERDRELVLGEDEAVGANAGRHRAIVPDDRPAAM